MHFSGFLTAWLLCLRFHGADAFMSPLHPSIYGKILGKPASPDTVDAVMNAKDAFSKTKHNFMGDFNVDLPKVSLPDAHGFGESFTLALNTMPNVGPNMDLIKKSILSGIADFPEDLSDFGYMIVDTLNLEEYGGWYVAAISIALSLGQRRARLEEAQERFAAMLREADKMAAEAAEAATVAVEEAKLAKVVTERMHSSVLKLKVETQILKGQLSSATTQMIPFSGFTPEMLEAMEDPDANARISALVNQIHQEKAAVVEDAMATEEVVADNTEEVKIAIDTANSNNIGAQKVDAEQIAAAQKAEAEKVAAAEKLKADEIAAVEKAAAEQAQADEIAAAEKAAAEKAKADEIAAVEKAAAAKAKADEIAALEKAAAEKAKADEIAALEKAAAEKAEVDKLAALEKAAAEKAGADEIAALQKAASEKAEADEIAAERSALAQAAEKVDDATPTWRQGWEEGVKTPSADKPKQAATGADPYIRTSVLLEAPRELKTEKVSTPAAAKPKQAATDADPYIRTTVLLEAPREPKREKASTTAAETAKQAAARAETAKQAAARADPYIRTTVLLEPPREAKKEKPPPRAAEKRKPADTGENPGWEVLKTPVTVAAEKVDQAATGAFQEWLQKGEKESTPAPPEKVNQKMEKATTTATGEKSRQAAAVVDPGWLQTREKTSKTPAAKAKQDATSGADPYIRNSIF